MVPLEAATLGVWSWLTLMLTTVTNAGVMIMRILGLDRK